MQIFTYYNLFYFFVVKIALPRTDRPWKIPVKQRILIEKENACLDPDPSNPDLGIVRICSGAPFCKRNSCVRKCCPEDEFYGAQGCHKKPSFAPPVYFRDFLKNVSMKIPSATSMDALDTPGS